MKIFFKMLTFILRYFLALLILLFSVATFMGKSYGQSVLLWFIVLLLIYWPTILKKGLGKFSGLTRTAIIILLLIVNVLVFKPAPKTSIYLSKEHQANLMKIYDKQVADWPADTEDIFLQTEYGTVHVLAYGDTANPPLVMLHAAGMGAHSWAENLPPVLDHYRIYSFDNIGEGSKSELNDALVFPKTGQEIADMYNALTDSLKITSAPVFGASNGGFIAMNLAYYYPDKVQSLALFGPMGITPLTGNSIMMLSIATMYPFQFIRDWVHEWALGNDAYIKQKYGDWFNGIMSGTMPSVARPLPMTTEQKKQMDLPILLYLGTKDAIVGDAEIAKTVASEFPNIRIKVLDSGHLIAVEHAQSINQELIEFLSASN